jgi:CspA family cold shock protein
MPRNGESQYTINDPELEDWWYKIQGLRRKQVGQTSSFGFRLGGAVKMEGRIKWFNNSKGYGFIGCENGPDVFVHYSGIVGDGYRTLQEGDRVSFELVQGPKGPQAVNVMKIETEK